MSDSKKMVLSRTYIVMYLEFMTLTGFPIKYFLTPRRSGHAMAMGKKEFEGMPSSQLRFERLS